MNKYLRIIVPALQVVAFIVIFMLGKMTPGDTMYFNFYAPARSVYMQLNFPVLVVWFPVVYVLEQFGGKLPANGTVFGALTVVGGLLFLSTIAAFWYCVVRDIEMRRNGASLIKSSRQSVQVLLSAIMFSFGIIASFRAYSEVTALWYSRRTEGILNGFFLVCWAVVFVALGINDLRSFLRNRTAAEETIPRVS